MKRLIALLLTAAILFSAGCAGKPSETTQPAAQQGGNAATTETYNGWVGTNDGGSKQVYTARDSITLRLNAEPGKIDPQTASGSGTDVQLDNQVYEGLFMSGMVDGVSMVHPALAESYTYLDAEQTQLQITLRKGIRFHNGEEMTADDVVFSLNRCIEKGYNDDLTTVIKSVEKVDDYTVLVTLPFSYSAILSVLACECFYIVNKKFCEATSEEDFAITECGTGPYMLTEWKRDSYLTLEAFPEYWRGEAAIKHVTYKIIKDNSAAMIAFENGEFDITNDIGSANEPHIEQNTSKYAVTGTPTTGCGRSIVFNCSTGVFADVRMRQAVALAVDREAVLWSAYDGVGMEGTMLIPAIYDECPDDLSMPAKDIEKAKQLVKDCGYANGVTATVTVSDQAQYTKAMVVLQQQLAEIGITLVVDQMERAAWNEKVLQNGEFEMTYYAIMADFADVDSLLYTMHTGQTGLFVSYNSAELDQLLDQGRTTVPGAERNAIYRKVAELFLKDMPAISLQNIVKKLFYHVGLEGVVSSPNTRNYIYDYYWSK